MDSPLSFLFLSFFWGGATISTPLADSDHADSEGRETEREVS